MKAKELKAWLKDVPDSAIILRFAQDEGFVEAERAILDRRTFNEMTGTWQSPPSTGRATTTVFLL